MRIGRRSSILCLGLTLPILLGIQCKSVNESADGEAKGMFHRSEDKMILPDGYEALSAGEKSELLFAQIQATKFAVLPELKSVSPLKFIFSHLLLKMDRVSDEAPSGYEKSIHAHGATAKVELEAIKNPYTGLFQGAPHGIIRLSVTSDPKGEDFAPGMGLKLLIDGRPSENVSALYKLSGQQSDHNFFKNELSHIIPIQLDLKSIFSMSNFGRVTRNPTKTSVTPFAAVDKLGGQIAEPIAPAQIYFVPNAALAAKSEVHDFREDLLKIPTGSVLYDIYASDERGTNFRNIDEARREKAVKIGRIISRSPFIASDFGDRRLFFRHYRYEDHN